MSITKYSNPVFRLSQLVESTKNEAGTVRHVLAELSGGVEDAELLRVAIDVLSLCREARVCVEEVEGIDGTLYVAPVVAAEIAFSQIANLNCNWSDIVGVLTPETVLGLKYSADMLRAHSVEHVIEEETLQELRTNLDEVETEVLTCQVNDNVKQVLHENICNMRRALALYSIHGVSGMLKALDESIGALVRLKKDLEPELEKSWFGSLWSGVQKYATAATAAVRTQQLLSGVRQMLETTKTD